MGSLRNLKRAPQTHRLIKPTAIEVFLKTLDRMLFICCNPTKPGSLIEKLSKEDRKALQRLTADDLNKCRVPAYGMTDPWIHLKKEEQELLLDFDKKMKPR